MTHRAIPRAAPSSCRGRTAPGYTLIELLVAIVVGGAILTVAATLMSRVIAANSSTEEHLRAIASLGELGRRFRDDVHRATAATVEPTQPPRLTLTLDDGSQVHYEGTSSGAARVQSVGDKLQRHEAYALGNYKVLSFRTANLETGSSETTEVQLRLGRVSQQPDDDTVIGEFAITAIASAATSATQPQEAPAP